MQGQAAMAGNNISEARLRQGCDGERPREALAAAHTQEPQATGRVLLARCTPRPAACAPADMWMSPTFRAPTPQC